MKVELISSMGSDLSVVNAARTFTQTRILEAVSRGYTVTESGEVLGPKGVLSVKLYGRQRYPTVSTNWDGRVFGVPVHMLAAYCFYGEDSFTKGVVIRHLNGNTLDVSKSNITLGTHSENNLDKPEKSRRDAAKKARAAQGTAARNRKLDEGAVAAVLSFYANLNGSKAPAGSVKELGSKYGVSRTVITKIKNGEYYACGFD